MADGDDPGYGGSAVGRAFLWGWKMGQGDLHFAHLWDNVALFAAIVAVHESGWPWPVWVHDIINPEWDDG